MSAVNQMGNCERSAEGDTVDCDASDGDYPTSQHRNELRRSVLRLARACSPGVERDELRSIARLLALFETRDQKLALITE